MRTLERRLSRVSLANSIFFRHAVDVNIGAPLIRGQNRQQLGGCLVKTEHSRVGLAPEWLQCAEARANHDHFFNGGAPVVSAGDSCEQLKGG
jgi:hypothetical protein